MIHTLNILSTKIQQKITAKELKDLYMKTIIDELNLLEKTVIIQ